MAMTSLIAAVAPQAKLLK